MVVPSSASLHIPLLGSTGSWLGVSWAQCLGPCFRLLLECMAHRCGRVLVCAPQPLVQVEPASLGGRSPVPLPCLLGKVPHPSQLQIHSWNGWKRGSWAHTDVFTPWVARLCEDTHGLHTWTQVGCAQGMTTHMHRCCRTGVPCESSFLAGNPLGLLRALGPGSLPPHTTPSTPKRLHEL